MAAVTVTLDQETVTLDLPEKLRVEDLQLDRFGLFAPGVGGSKVKIYFDGSDEHLSLQFRPQSTRRPSQFALLPILAFDLS